jgi:competence ComEA-like helix-hairpin-helix protein
MNVSDHRALSASIGLLAAGVVALLLTLPRPWAEAPPGAVVIRTAPEGAGFIWEPDPAGAAGQVRAEPELVGWRGMLLGRPLDCATATWEDLRALPGVGPKTADAILRAREKRGGFTSPRQLLDAPGVGRVKWEEMRHWIAGGAETSDAPGEGG